MVSRIILSLLGSFLLLTLVSCGEKHQPKGKYPKEKKEPEKQFFGGLFPGKCARNGVYIRDAYSLVFCSNMNKYVQPCAPGTRNGPLHAYLPGAKYGPTDFCNVNLVPYGDTPYMYPILQYGGLPLPFKHTEKDGYIPYIFLPKQIYPRDKEPHRTKGIRSGYLHPLDGHKMVENIKDTHLYEKPDAVHGYHSSDLEKDYNAIRHSYDQRKRADNEFREAYKEVDEQINDDYKPQYKNEFDKFEKSFGYDKSENKHKLDTYDAPQKYEKHDTKEKTIKYKETRYSPPIMKPNKYGEIKDLPPKYKNMKKYEPPKYEAPQYESDGYGKDMDETYDVPKYESTGSYHSTKYPSPTKYESKKYESPPYEPAKKVYKPVEEQDREFDLFYNSNSHANTNVKVKGATYSDDTFGEYGVGRVETKHDKPTKAPYSAPLREEIHGSHYIQHSTNKWGSKD